MIVEKGKLLKLYFGEEDRWHSEPLYHALIKRIKAEGLSGATILRGIEGYGAGSAIHSTRILRLSEDLPIVIEVADTPEKIEALIEALSEMLGPGVAVTLQDIEILKHTT